MWTHSLNRVAVLTACLTIAWAASAPAADSPDGVWQTVDALPREATSLEPWVQPERFQACRLNEATLNDRLKQAPQEFTAEAAGKPLVTTLPMPDGTFERFTVVESPIMEPALAAAFPDIRTYAGQGVDDPAATIRFDMTPAGFHAQILSPRGAVYIDPCFRGNTSLYASYYKRDYHKGDTGFECLVTGGVNVEGPQAESAAALTSGEQLHTYRLACAATGEYTAYHGGTVTAGQAAILTAINRVTGIYERELAIRLILVANNNLLVYTNAASDPYTNSDGFAMLSQNVSTVNSVIGPSNYDIGHVFSTGGGGVAYLGVVCGGSKAGGVTGRSAPVGDPFYVDYVAHEMGHQFGANHTFNGVGGSCSGGNRNASTAYEPGSGTTIMAYAGICGVSDDLQPNSDPHFHFISFEEIRSYVTGGTGGSCPVVTSTGNNAPTVEAGANYTIPHNTPFALTAAGGDPNGDALTYAWEERDLGAAQAAAGTPDNGASPLFRSWIPTADPTRTFPRLSDLLNNTTVIGEKMPTTSRALRFRVTARDNRNGGGGVSSDDCQLTVTTLAGPFRVTAPNTAVTWAGLQTVTWDVAGTSGSPVNAASVDILLSTDGGLTYPTVLAAGAFNDGSHQVALPSTLTSTARIRIQAAGNVFFDVSDVNFSIVPGNTVYFVADGPGSLDDSSGNGNNNGRMDPGESAVTLLLPLGNGGGLTGTGITATLSSLTASVSVTSAFSAYPDLSAGGTGTNATPFMVAIDPAHPCGNPIQLRLSVACAQGGNDVDFSFPTGAAAAPVIISYTGPVVAIPDNNTDVSIPLAVSGVGPISDLDFRFDGTSCSTDPASTTVGLNHSWVGDLDIRLISPGGTEVTLMQNAGGGTFGSDGNNLCQTLFDDDGSFPFIQTITAADAPHTGTWVPAQPLASFDGQNADGTWLLRLRDKASGDTGSLRAFSLVFPAPLVCDPPAAVSPSIVDAASRRSHASAGPFDVQVATAGAVEPRLGGATQIEVTFNMAVQGTGGLDPGDVSLSSGSVTGASIAGNVLTIDMTGVAANSTLLVGFPGIADAANASAVVADMLCFDNLGGDTNGDRSVNIFDLIAIRNVLNQAVSSVNFRDDVNADGAINIFDLIATRNNLNSTVTGNCP